MERAAKHTGLSYKAANDLVERMVEVGLLKEITGQNRNRIFVLEAYVGVFG